MRSSLLSMYRGFRPAWADGSGVLHPPEAALDSVAQPSGEARVAGLSRLLAGGVEAAEHDVPAHCDSTLGLRPPTTMGSTAAETEASGDEAWLAARGDERRAKRASASDWCSRGAPRRKPRRASGTSAGAAFGVLGSSLLGSAVGTMGVPGEVRWQVGLSCRMRARACSALFGSRAAAAAPSASQSSSARAPSSLPWVCSCCGVGGDGGVVTNWDGGLAGTQLTSCRMRSGGVSSASGGLP